MTIPTPLVTVQQVFYTSLANYQANAAAYNSSVFINTPITTDTNGNVFFGFRVQGTAPAPLSTTQSGFARIDPSGNATYVLVNAAANDANIGRDSHNSALALTMITFRPPSHSPCANGASTLPPSIPQPTACSLRARTVTSIAGIWPPM